MRICCDTLFGCKSAMSNRYLGRHISDWWFLSPNLEETIPLHALNAKKLCKMLRIWPSKALTFDLWIVGLALLEVHQYPYCWELRDHEVLKIEGFLMFFFDKRRYTMIINDDFLSGKWKDFDIQWRTCVNYLRDGHMKRWLRVQRTGIVRVTAVQNPGPFLNKFPLSLW